MKKTPPHENIKIRLVPDEYYLTHVGKLADGKLYWIDVQLSSDANTRDTRDFVCTYIFDGDGRLFAHEIEDLGLRSENIVDASAVIARHLAALNRPKRKSVWIHPFEVQTNGLTFGLVVREEDVEIGDDPLVDAMPGMTLVFYPPWRKGRYDT